MLTSVRYVLTSVGVSSTNTLLKLKYPCFLPGCVARCHTSLTDSIFLSSGACKTIVVEPTTHRIQPRTPKICSFSFNIK